ncbi:MAG: hypothetical protein ACREP0_07895, partial [Rhodanobacteraceae bacterium]
TAAAADYGSNSPLLAANTDASAVDGAQARGESPGMAAIDTNDSDESAAAASEDTTASGPQRVTGTATSPHPDASARTPGPSASGKPRAPAVQPAAPLATASWQSLLPGSIQ